jgi:FSR family fosmidomycin resistance protein-like MFS transporter
VEFADELADGTKGAALPLIRSDLGLSYAQIGLLIGIPLLVGSLLELPLGLVAGRGRRRHRLVLAGGAVFIGSLAAVAAAQSFGVLMLAFIAFFPASGAFVSLTQAALVDAAPGRQQQRMAAWNLAGSAGAVGGPLLLAGVLAAGGGWRPAYLLLAAAAGAALAGAAVAGPARRAPADPAGPAGPAEGADDDGADDDGRRPAIRDVLAALRTGGTLRWLVLLEVGDLLLDVLTGYVGIYLVDVAHASPAEAAVGVAVRLGGGLAGDALFVAIARRVSGPAVLRVSAIAAGLLYPAFLLVPWLPAKLVILAALSMATACWYPVIQSGLYVSLPGRSDIAVFLSSVAGLIGAAGPLAVGFVAQQAGLAWALAGLAAAPAIVLAVRPRDARAGSRKVLR